MKKSVLVLSMLALFVITGGLIVSCNKSNEKVVKNAKIESVATLSQADQDLINTYWGIGAYHNNGLDYIHTELVALKADKISQNGSFSCTMQEMYDAYHQYTMDYVTNNVTEISSLNSTEIALIETDITEFNDNFFNNATTEYSNSYIETEFAISLSTDFKDAMNDVIAIGGNHSLSLQDKIDAWDDLLEAEIGNLTDEKEKIALIAAISTAESTFAYWTNSANQNKWADLFDVSPSVYTDARISQDGWNDIWGAAGMGIRVGLQAASFGPAAAVAGFVVGGVAGAASGTAGGVIKNFIQSWFD